MVAINSNINETDRRKTCLHAAHVVTSQCPDDSTVQTELSSLDRDMESLLHYVFSNATVHKNKENV